MPMPQSCHSKLADLLPYGKTLPTLLFFMHPLSLFSLIFSSVIIAAHVLAQDPVQIQFQTDPLVVQTGTEIVFTVLTQSQVLSMTWEYQGQTLGLWAGGTPVINPVDQFLGRVTISATQLRIGGAQLRDRGSYTVQVIPTATTGLAPNSMSGQLGVYGKR